ncbi:MAG: thermonuclease family protein [Patescibacteria group bacterium]|jgi:micrococcal nuclease|nr:thermonuclease family protein [Patescibacteria group bacterium]
MFNKRKKPKDKKIFNINIVSWFLGIVFYFSFFGYVWSLDLINAVIFLLIAIITFPPSYKLLENQLKKRYDFSLGSIHRLALIISLFIIFNLLNPSELNKDISLENLDDIKPSSLLNQFENTEEKVAESNENIELKKLTSYKVIDVIDGDTIKVNIDNQIKTVRLIGIDTPETVHPEKPVECFGRESSQKLKELLSGAEVYLEKDKTQDNLDKYSRLLRYVYRNDNLFINKWMIENGYAYEFTYEIPYIYQNDFKEAETSAKNNKLGLWSDDVCIDFDSQPTEENKKYCLIKGNISYNTGEKIYHHLGCDEYEKTIINTAKGEKWFCSEEEALKAGWRVAESCP